MPRFYFDLSDGTTSIADEHGIMCTSLDDAEQQALRHLPLMVAQRRTGRDTYASMVIRDQAGRQLVHVTLILSAQTIAHPVMAGIE